jgi:hypothetical protein
MGTVISTRIKLIILFTRAMRALKLHGVVILSQGTKPPDNVVLVDDDVVLELVVAGVVVVLVAGVSVVVEELAVGVVCDNGKVCNCCVCSVVSRVGVSVWRSGVAPPFTVIELDPVNPVYPGATKFTGVWSDGVVVCACTCVVRLKIPTKNMRMKNM